MNINPWLAAAFIAAALIVIYKILGGGKAPMSAVSDKIKAGAQIVDVRSVEEFRDGYYAGAVNIPVQELPRRMGELQKDKAVVLYCASGARSGAAARMLKASGFKDVINAGGLTDMPR